jgi:hypothetical protein
MFELVLFSPGFNNCTISGTTTNLPVKTALSPGFGRSTISPLKMISIDLGIEPAGISLEYS